MGTSQAGEERGERGDNKTGGLLSLSLCLSLPLDSWQDLNDNNTDVLSSPDVTDTLTHFVIGESQ